jgi:hypothetical protein
VKLLRSLTFLITFLWGSLGHAIEVKDLLEACGSKLREDQVLCSGYIMGHVDGRIAMGAWRSKNKNCTAPQPYNKLTEIVIADLKVARRDDWPAGEAIKSVLSKRFPCVQSTLER